jgi:hypothetical protein
VLAQQNEHFHTSFELAAYARDSLHCGADNIKHSNHIFEPHRTSAFGEGRQEK